MTCQKSEMSLKFSHNLSKTKMLSYYWLVMKHYGKRRNSVLKRALAHRRRCNILRAKLSMCFKQVNILAASILLNENTIQRNRKIWKLVSIFFSFYYFYLSQCFIRTEKVVFGKMKFQPSMRTNLKKIFALIGNLSKKL